MWLFPSTRWPVFAVFMEISCCLDQAQCELPESYEAYRKQQHRWHSGPMQLFRLCLPAIIKSKVLTCFSTTIAKCKNPLKKLLKTNLVLFLRVSW